VSPRVQEDSVHPRLQSGRTATDRRASFHRYAACALARPLNFTVSLTGESAMGTVSQQFKLATVVPNAGDPESKFYATTKPQRAVQASLERTRMRLRSAQQFSPGAPSRRCRLRHVNGSTPGPGPKAGKLTIVPADGQTAAAELHR